MSGSVLAGYLLGTILSVTPIVPPVIILAIRSNPSSIFARYDPGVPNI